MKMGSKKIILRLSEFLNDFFYYMVQVSNAYIPAGPKSIDKKLTVHMENVQKYALLELFMFVTIVRYRLSWNDISNR